MRRYKILIFIEADVVVRHFLKSDAFVDLAKKHDVCFIFPELGHKRIKDVDFSKLDLPSRYRHIKTNPLRVTAWKWLYLAEQLKFGFDPQRVALRRLHRSTLGWKASSLLTIASFPGFFWAFRRWIKNRLKLNPNRELEEVFDKECPDLIIHPCVLEGLFLNDLVEAARRRSMPLVVIMNSWDNPSTKRSMVGLPDWLLVWGEQTWQHAVEFAKMPPNRTIKFGAAQFEVFRTSPRCDKSQFIRINGIKGDKPILLYAGSSKGTDEIAHLTLLDKAVTQEKLPPITILYRPHPWGAGGKNGNKILDQKWNHVVIEQSMRSYLERVQAGSTSKYLTDYQDVHDVLCHVDAVVSPLSTILLEAAMHGKPGLCFLPLEDKSNHFRDDLRLKHFHDMFGRPEMLVAAGYEQLVPRAQELIERIGEEKWRGLLHEFSKYFVEPHEQPFRQRIVKFAESIIENKK